MAEQAQLEPSLPPARRSKKLVIIATTLAFLPLVLPVPFFGLDHLWIAPVYDAKLQACPLRDCPILLTLDRLTAVLILGPSVLVALASILLGIIGLIRMPLRPNAPNYIDTFVVSVLMGILWLALFGYMLWLLPTILINL